jgi:hypothetical protein
MLGGPLCPMSVNHLDILITVGTEADPTSDTPVFSLTPETILIILQRGSRKDPDGFRPKVEDYGFARIPWTFSAS